MWVMKCHSDLFFEDLIKETFQSWVPVFRYFVAEPRFEIETPSTFAISATLPINLVK
jgi:hypothetical protein